MEKYSQNKEKFYNYIKKYNKNTFLMYNSLLDNNFNIILETLQLLFNKYKTNKPILIVSSNLKIQIFNIQIKKLGLNYKNFYFMNHNTFYSNIKLNHRYCDNMIICLDNCENYRYINKQSETINNSLNKSLFTLLVSNNLFINKIDDIIPIISFLLRISIEEAIQLFILSKTKEDIFNKIFSGRIFFNKKKLSNINYDENDIILNIDNKRYFDYLELKKNIEENLELKKSKPVNKILELKQKSFSLPNLEKLNWILKFLKTHKSQKTIIYTPYNSEIQQHELKEFLTKNKIHYLFFPFYSTILQNKTIIDSFNNNKSNVLLINNISIHNQYFLPHINNIIITDPIYDFEQYNHLVSNLELSKNILKKTSKKTIKVFKLILGLPVKTGILEKFKNIFAYVKEKTIDCIINDNNKYNKNSIKSFITKLQKYSIYS